MLYVLLVTFYVAGTDEVGRGAFAGPLVVVAALFRLEGEWDEDPAKCPCPISGVKDSKAFGSGPKAREKRAIVAQAIRDHAVLASAGVGGVRPEEINEHGMGWALRKAFEQAVSMLYPAPELLLVDGDYPVRGWKGPQMCRPKADKFWWPVSAASILAKVARDQLMAELHTQFPVYGWEGNSGYGVPAHLAAIRAHGMTPHHRVSFVESALSKG